MKLRTGIVRSALALGLLLGSAPAFAAGVDPAVATAVQREQAQALFAKGKKAYDENKLPEALEAFKSSIEIVQSPNTRLYVARTLREMGRLVEAYAELGRTMAEAKEHEHEDGRYGKAAQAAQAERAELGKKLGFVRLAITNASDDAKLTVGGAEIVRAGWIEPIPAMPGTVEIVLTSGSGAPVTKSATVVAGQTVDVTLESTTHGDGTPPPPPPPTVPDETGHGPPWRPMWIAGYGVGAFGLGMFAIAGAMSNGTYSDVKAACGNGPCPASQASLVERGQREQTIANVGLVIGLIGVAAGTTFLVLDLTSKKGAAAPATPPPAGPPAAALRFGLASVELVGTF
jgi:hypothetical protein